MEYNLFYEKSKTESRNFYLGRIEMIGEFQIFV